MGSTGPEEDALDAGVGYDQLGLKDLISLSPDVSFFTSSFICRVLRYFLYVSMLGSYSAVKLYVSTIIILPTYLGTSQIPMKSTSSNILAKNAPNIRTPPLEPPSYNSAALPSCIANVTTLLHLP